MIKPLKTVIFFLLAGLFLLPTVLFMPEDGIEVGPFTLKMLTLNDLLGQDTVEYVDISDIVNPISNIDSLPDITEVDQIVDDSTENIPDTIRADAKALAASVYRLQFPEGNKNSLKKFFAALDKLSSKKGLVRIMHYGDSQIEGDRISSYIRNKLQKKYGGTGPGLLPALQPYDSYFSIKQSNIGTWKRYAIFGRKNPEVLHKKYGALAAFSRFAPINNDSIFKDSLLYQGEILFEESSMAYGLVRKFQKVQIFYGNARRSVAISLWVDGVEITTDSLKADVDYARYSYTLPTETKSLTIKFSGYDSPDIYGISLDSKTGISLTNIGMRGSSGTIFNKMDYGHLNKMYSNLDVKLFILQFGGNVMPYIKDSSEAINYGRWFGSQLRTLKRMNPNASFVVIGPSDMSHKVKENYVTYDFLPLVRDELKKATFKAGMPYWDMYEAMGGYNSMPSWVNAKPALAGSDYTHFTPRGAKLIANMFYNALMIER
jgi:lysophospholipase L1-like esterase